MWGQANIGSREDFRVLVAAGMGSTGHGAGGNGSFAAVATQGLESVVN